MSRFEEKIQWARFVLVLPTWWQLSLLQKDVHNFCQICEQSFRRGGVRFVPIVLMYDVGMVLEQKERGSTLMSRF